MASSTHSSRDDARAAIAPALARVALVRLASALLVLAPLIAACGTTGTVSGGVLDPNATSAICPGARGALAVYWDWANGVFHPLRAIPAPEGGWPSYFHPGYPPLSFLYPPAFEAITIAAEGDVGVHLRRFDGRALWHWEGFTWTTGANPAARQIRDVVIDQIAAEVGAGGQRTMICTFEQTNTPAPGVTLAVSNIALDVGDTTMVVQVSVANAGLAPMVQLGAAVGPVGDFPDLVAHTFLPIHFQLFYGKTVQDSDGDGVPDSLDSKPFDPTVQ